MTDLGPGRAYAVNNQDVVVGDGPTAAFLYNQQGRTNISFEWWYGLPEFSDRSTATGAHGINDSGVIAGTFTYIMGLKHVFRWNQTGLAEAYYPGTAAEGINSSGQIVGSALFQPDWTVVPLQGTGYAINDGGTLVGQNLTLQAATQAPGGSFVPLDLGALGTELPYSSANAINSAGQIAGMVYSTSPFGVGEYRLFLWSAGTVTLLAKSDGAYATQGGALGINDAGVVVGRIAAIGPCVSLEGGAIGGP